MGNMTGAWIPLLAIALSVLVWIMLWSIWAYADQAHSRTMEEQEESIRKDFIRDQPEATWQQIAAAPRLIQSREYARRETKERKWKKIGSFAGVTALLAAIFVVLPQIHDRRIDDARAQAQIAFSAGWGEICEAIFTSSPTETLYYHGVAYKNEWCKGLNPQTFPQGFPTWRIDFDFWGEPGAQSYIDAGTRQGRSMAWRTIFAAVPELCFDSKCWDMFGMIDELRRIYPQDERDSGFWHLAVPDHL